MYIPTFHANAMKSRPYVLCNIADELTLVVLRFALY